ncbi:MAG: TIGR02996 domain-containing protein [Kofleriaceae bacterium]
MTRERNPQLHAAVLAAPDDDAPRLAYADWLTARGDPWGELISVQIARTLADTPELRNRERELLESPPQPRGEFRRGFVEFLYADLATLDEQLADTCVRVLRIREDARVPHQAVRIAMALPRMRLRSIELGTMSDDDLATLCNALGDSLDAFSYGWGHGSVSTAQTLAITRSRLRVSSLALSGIEPDALAALAVSHPLRSLSLEASDLGRGVFKTIVDAPALARCEHLELSYTGIGEEDVFAIASSAMPLVSLGLSGNALGPAAAHRIANTPRFAALRRLRIARCKIGNAGLDALLASPYLSRDMQLCLDRRALGWPHVVESSGNIWEEPGDRAVTERIEARFEIAGDDAIIVDEDEST